jgi:hypothetical protein
VHLVYEKERNRHNQRQNEKSDDFPFNVSRILGVARNTLSRRDIPFEPVVGKRKDSRTRISPDWVSTIDILRI